jgi:hypothetical protein
MTTCNEARSKGEHHSRRCKVREAARNKKYVTAQKKAQSKKGKVSK